jgi:hypothetical protein
MGRQILLLAGRTGTTNLGPYLAGSPQSYFTDSHCEFDWESRQMILATNFPVAAVGLASALLIGPPNEARAAPPSAVATAFELAQAMLPRTGMMDAQHPMPMNERYLKRFPQPVRVGDLIGLPVLDLNSSTIGFVREIVRTAAGQIEFIINYSRWWGWFGRPVAVPLEKLGIEGRHLMSLDMSPSDYAAAPTWHSTGAAPLSADATVRVALSRS